MRLEQFDYHLPESLIAQHPLEERTASRLMVVDRKRPDDDAVGAHATFSELPDYLDENDIVVVNRTRVIPARLLLQRETGGEVEVLCMRRHGPMEFSAWVRPIGRLKPGEILTAPDPRFHFRFVARTGDREAMIQLDPGAEDRLTLENAIRAIGHVPLPPYIRRPDEPADQDRYQTVYAKEEGSVAAPTAGLHFDDALLERLRKAGVEIAPLVLHVGAGTFSPLEEENVESNELEPESFGMPAGTINAIRRAKETGKRIVAVGTTVTRALESAHSMGWFGADPPDHGRIAETRLFIYPGYRFQVVDRLVTNFHLPRSSLLLLVSAFAGRERALACYRSAVAESYRFYSYGDAMLIL
jgi:S-adenosylmethionine:tRNA ribosyltransferase-isomerase